MPTIYSDNLSWWAAYILFDNPLVCGQENSTRAVTRKGWPMARECYIKETVTQGGGVIMVGREIQTGETKEVTVTVPHPDLAELDKLGMDIFLAEVEAWKAELKAPCETCGGQAVKPRLPGTELDFVCDTCNGTGRKYPWMKDPQAFRPALDRARWALPGTISTGAAWSSHVRERSRTIRDGLALAQGSPAAIEMFEEIKAAYQAAVPGIGALGLREAVYATDKLIVPLHLQVTQAGMVNPMPVRLGGVACKLDLRGMHTGPAREPNSYADPSWNAARVDTTIQCSLAVSRDWHRHRTFYPWTLRLVSREGKFLLDNHYEPLSELGKAKVDEYFIRARQAYNRFVTAGDHFRAMLCLPFGTAVQMSGSAGLRDWIYTSELRAFSHGANFEYEEQAKLMLVNLVKQLGPELCDTLKVTPPE